MAYELKEGQGSLFKNNKVSVNAPDCKGSVLINGQLYEIAGWKRESERAGTWLSLSVKLKQDDLPAGSRSDVTDEKEELPF